MKYKILFSIPVHEKLEVVLDQIANIFTLNKDCGIVLHFSPVFDYANSAIDKDTFIKKIEAYNSNSGGVFLNPQSVRTGFFDIIQAHIANFRYVSTVAEFEYVALLASNEIFVKPNLYDHIKKFDVGVNDGIIPVTSKTGTGKGAHKDKDLKNIIKSINTNDIYWSQIEGSYYKSEIFDSICDVIDKHFDYKTIDKDDLYAREEVYFPTVFWGLYKGSDTIKVDKKGMFTFVPWQRVGISVNIGEAIWHSKNESDIFCIKRVARKLEDPVRSYIRQKYNYSDFFGLSNLVCRYPLLYIQIRDMYRRIQLKYIDRIKTKLKK